MTQLIRCPWCGTDPLYVTYHDEEWGVPVHNDTKLFEFLTLEGAQAGLSWITVLRKRENYRKHFHNWDIEKIAKMTDDELEIILTDPGVIRNRLKIYSVRKNARVALEIQKEYGSLDAYFWKTPFVNGDLVSENSEQNPQSLRASSFAKELRNFPIIHHGKSIYDFPTEDTLSKSLSKDLKKRGMTFVGSTIMYAWMQAIGMVNDHIDTCYRKGV